MRKRRETGWGGGGGGVGCGGILPWMSTDRDFFIPITKTSSLSHKGTTRQTGESVAPDWIGHFFFFWWREMSKSGNGFYISSVISRASRWASWVFILQTPNLDLPLHMWMREWSQTALEMWKNQNEPGICLPPPPPKVLRWTSPAKLMKNVYYLGRQEWGIGDVLHTRMYKHITSAFQPWNIKHCQDCISHQLLCISHVCGRETRHECGFPAIWFHLQCICFP